MNEEKHNVETYHSHEIKILMMLLRDAKIKSPSGKLLVL